MSYIELDLSNSVNPFVPTDITGCKLWLNGSEVVLDVNGDVVCWKDQSGTGHNYYQSVLADRPHWTAAHATFNNHPVVEFDAANTEAFNSLTTDAGPQPTDIMTDTAKEYFAVCRATTAAALGAFFNTASGILSGYSGTYGVHIASNAGVPTAIIGNWDGTNDQLNLPYTSFSNPVLIAGRHNGTDIRGSLNGGTEATPVNSGTTTVFINSTTLGQSPQAAGTYLTGQIAEIIVYNAIMTAGQRNQVIAYLMHKYNLSSSP